MSLSGKSNINPKIWGPHIWKTMHFVAHGYPEKPNDVDKKAYRDFYENITKVLPCDKCSISSQELLKKMDITSALNSKEDLIKWVYTFHDAVNNKLGKVSPSFEDYISNFTNQTVGFDYTFTIILVLILILMIYLYFKNQ
tara:strand:+ start:285 stop:704 length:420 start_codon:yes stop_codon:yes gene_type:complete